MSKSKRDFTVGEIEDAGRYIPQGAYDVAYGLRDFAANFFGDCEISLGVDYWHRLRDSYDSVHTSKTIRYTVETHSIYHNDTETTSRLVIGDKQLKLGEEKSFAEPIPSIFSDKPESFQIRHAK